MPKTMIAIPCMDTVHTSFFESVLGLRREECTIAIARSSLIYDARNKLAEKAVSDGFDRVLWLDSDMMFPSDMYYKLSEDLDADHRVVSGIYFTRKGNIEPVFYSEMGTRKVDNGSDQIEAYRIAMTDYPKDSLFEVAGVGFGCVMMETSVLAEMYKKLGAPFFPVSGFGEDLAFCMRCNNLGIKIYCDSSIKAGHCATTMITEEAYLSGYKLLEFK